MRLAPAALLALVLPLSLAAAEAPPPDDARKLEWSLSGEARFRPEWRNDRDLDAGIGDDTRQGFMRIRLGVDLAVREGGSYRLFFQAQDSRVAGEEPSTAANTRNLDLHQGFLEIKRAGIDGLSLALGRQEWKYGEERLIGAFGWDNVGRSFDGIRLRYARGDFFVDGLLARLSTSAGPGATTGSDFYGLQAQAAPRAGAEYGAYLLGFADNVPVAGETGVPGDTSIHALGGRMKDRFGRFDLNVEATVERGEFRGDDLDAVALAVQGGATWGEATKVRAFAGYDFATGDEDSTDGEREEFFNFFPTNHPHYGYADLEGWRNLTSPWAGVSVARGRHFGQIKVHWLSLDEPGGPWKDAGGNVLGFDATGASGTRVGTEIDLLYRLKLGQKLSIEAGYSRFEPGRFAEATRGADASDWGYLMLTLGL